MEEDHIPFKEESFGTKILIVVFVTVLIGVAIGLVVAGYYFGILGVFKLLGVYYDSLFSLFLFVICYLLLGIIGDVIIETFKIILSIFKNNPANKLVLFIIYFLVNWFLILLVDSFMDSISIQTETQIVVGIIIGLIEFTLDNNGKRVTKGNIWGNMS